MSYSTDRKFAVLDATSGVALESYSSREQLVRGVVLERAFGGAYFGCPGHRAALKKLHVGIEELLEQLKQDSEE